MQASLAGFINRHKLFGPDDTILLAVSGGVDSMVLCELFQRAGISIAIAHCNFGLRGHESDEDEQFIRRYALSKHIPFHAKQCDTLTYAASCRLSVQEAARELRYTYFNELIAAEGYHAVATAHHADDQMETMLLNLLRGTGIAGLHGILPRRGNVIRPLLFATKDEIVAYAEANGLAYREDSSNHLAKYLRNRVRHEVVLHLKSIREDAVRSFAKTAEAVQVSEQLLQFFLDRVKDETVTEDAITGELRIQIPLLESYPQPQEILYWILNTRGFSRSQCADLLLADTGSKHHTLTHTALVDRSEILITEQVEATIPEIVEVREPGIYRFGPYRIEVEEAGAASTEFSHDKCEAVIDVDFPFTIRSWQEGDRIQPLGMKGTKLLSDVFIDTRIPLSRKNSIPVLVKNGDVFWVAGIVQSDRFKLSADSGKVLKLFLHSPVTEREN